MQRENNCIVEHEEHPIPECLWQVHDVQHEGHLLSSLKGQKMASWQHDHVRVHVNKPQRQGVHVTIRD